jgi:hypothetical protein
MEQAFSRLEAFVQLIEPEDRWVVSTGENRTFITDSLHNANNVAGIVISSSHERTITAGFEKTVQQIFTIREKYFGTPVVTHSSPDQIPNLGNDPE